MDARSALVVTKDYWKTKRTQSDELWEASLRKETFKVISESAQKGKFACTISGHIGERALQELISLGYDARHVGGMLNPHTTIDWRTADHGSRT